MTIYVDPFTRADTAVGGGLGAVPSGPTYLYNGSFRILGNRAYCDTADSSHPYAYFASGVGNIDLSMSVSSNGGDAIYFRIEDSNNWFRARIRRYQTLVDGGSYYVQPTYAYDHTWTAGYPWDAGASTAEHYEYQTFTYRSSSTAYPGNVYSFPATINHNHAVYRDDGSLVSSTYGHTHPSSGRVMAVAYGGYTQVQTGGGYYADNPDYYVTNYQLILDRRINGAITTIISANISAPTSLRVRALGNAISVYHSGGSTATLTATDTTTFTRNKHGFGRAPSDLTGTSLDNLSYNDLNSAPAAPTVTSPNGGETVDASAPITWTAGTDPDGDTLRYNVDLSTNSGSTWTRIKSLVTGTSTTYDFTSVTANSTSLIRVQAVDTSGLTSSWDTSNAVFTVEHDADPFAPLLQSPSNNSYADLAAGFTFTWQFRDPDTGNTQTAYAFRRKIAGATAYEWWNDTTSTWQSTEVFNANVSTSKTFAATKWTNGNVYNWSVATKDNTSRTGPYSADRTVIANIGPQVTVNPVSASTTSPSISWNYSDDENDPQTTYTVKIFDLITYAGSSFDPDTDTPIWTSGTVASASVFNVVVGISLQQNVQYRAYVQVTGGGLSSVWAYAAFTITLNPPATPILSAFNDDEWGRTRLIVQGRDNLLTADAASGLLASTADTTVTGPDAEGFYTYTTTSANTMTFPATADTIAGSWVWAITFDNNSATARTVTVAVSGGAGESVVVPGSATTTLTGVATVDTQATGTLSLTLPTSMSLGIKDVLLRRNVDGTTDWTRGGLVGGSYARVEWSDDGITWETLLNGRLLLPVTAQTETFFDYLGTPGIARLYRASIEAEVA